MKRKQIVIVGRPNVGKSTLFNRLVGRRKALVHDQAGVTRDWSSEPVRLGRAEIELVDTGGVDLSESGVLAAAARDMAVRRLSAADLVLFLVDGRAGPVGGDQEIAELIRPLNIPVLLVVNKSDVRVTGEGLAEFWALGLDEPLPVSAEHGLGMADLESRLAELVGAADVAESEEGPVDSPPRVALVGRPNVGKSSLVNRLLGDERMIVSEIPGTTRDSVDSLIRVEGRDYVLVDTAGLRKPTRTSTAPDHLATMLAERALERSDVAVLVIDANEGPTTKDASIAGRIVDARRPVVVLGNKWDLGPPDGFEPLDLEREVRRRLPMLAHAELILVSALSGRRLPRLWSAVDRALVENRHRIPTAELNRWAATLEDSGPPLLIGGRPAKLKYVSQVSVEPPTFALFCNRAGPLAGPSRRFLENRLRELHPFAGAPIVFRVSGAGGSRGEDRGRRRRAV